MPVTVPAFLAEPSAVPIAISAHADRSAETMDRLRHPFRTQPDRDDDDAVAGAVR